MKNSDIGKRIPDKMRNRVHDSHQLPDALRNPKSNICKEIPESLKNGIPDSHTMPDPKFDSF